MNQSIPEYILIQSPHDLRTPQALADLEQMADRVSQLPNVAAVSGITRPTGNVPEQFRATYQAGAIGTCWPAGPARSTTTPMTSTGWPTGPTRWPTTSATCAARSASSLPACRA